MSEKVWQYFSTENGQCYAKRANDVWIFAGLDGLDAGNYVTATLPADAVETSREAIEACGLEMPEDLQ